MYTFVEDALEARKDGVESSSGQRATSSLRTVLLAELTRNVAHARLEDGFCSSTQE
jgi:hypothetical protein